MSHRMLPRSLSLILWIGLLAGSLMPIASAAQPSELETHFNEARVAWDEGDYVAALEGFQDVLTADDGDRFFEDIALITGELYEVTHIADDGAALQFSPDGEHVSYEQTRDGTRYTVVVSIAADTPEEVDRFEGTGFVFAPDGVTGTYQRIQPNSAMQDAAQQFQTARQNRDRAAMRQANTALQWHTAQATTWHERQIADSTSTPWSHDGQMLTDPVYDDAGRLYMVGMDADQPDRSHIYRFDDASSAPIRIHNDAPGYRTDAHPIADGAQVVYRTVDAPPFSMPANRQPSSVDAEPGTITLHDLEAETTTTFAGDALAVARDGSTLAYRTQSDAGSDTAYRLHVRPIDTPTEADTLTERSAEPTALALSPDGATLAFNERKDITDQVYLTDTATGDTEQFTRDIQHELFPEFLDNETLLAKMGESRHRRAHVYDLDTGTAQRLFHNNRVRTVSMEYEWATGPRGERILLRADRDGNTISEEESVHLVDRTRRISQEALLERIARQVDSERARRADAEAMFAPIREEVEAATDAVTLTYLYDYQKALYDFDTKYFTEPGNRKASTYIHDTFESFGYDPEKQWFMPNGRDSTANVVARLEGSEHPEVVYIYSAHYDSVLDGPGADDNSTGIAVMLEMARVLADTELPATIIFAALTAEEAGLLGAQEFVRRAEEDGMQVAGVVNNDMMGWTRHHRLDNTIRFSNYGIRDVQHAASMLFSDLITYDSRYYRFTDAHVFFNAYGDVIGGIGSYPILGNPNYHQPTDQLETINHRLVRAVAQSNTGVFMKLAHTPSRLRNLGAERTDAGYIVQWSEPLETDITHYEVRYHTPSGDTVTEETEECTLTVEEPDTEHPIAVRAVNENGMAGWDWAEVTIE